MPPKVKSSHGEAWFVISLTLILTLLGLVAVYKNKLPQTNIPSLVQQPTKPTLVKTPTVFFSTPVYLKRNKTFITIPFNFETHPQTLWLTLQTPAGVKPIIRLINHPFVSNLTWPYLLEGGLRLYQVKPTFTTFADFLAQPPAKNTILVDPHLLKTSQFANLKALPLPDDPNQIKADQIKYVLTTFAGFRPEGQFLNFETTLDATDAFVTNDNKLNWQIDAPLANPDNPFQMGGVHVDYRQY